MEEGELSSCEGPPPDPPAPRPRVWTHWSNRRDGDDYNIQVQNSKIIFMPPKIKYHKVTNTSTSRLEVTSSFYRLFMKGKLDVYLL